MEPLKGCSAIILSAGNSSRMGASKALLPFTSETTFLEQLVKTYQESGIEEIICVANETLFDLYRSQPMFQNNILHWVLNDSPHLGRFHSLTCGLLQIRKGNYCFFQNIDNPFTEVDTIRKLYQSRSVSKILVPAYKNYHGHPVLLHPDVIQDMLQRDNSRETIRDYLHNSGIHYIHYDQVGILANINTREDYLKWFKG